MPSRSRSTSARAALELGPLPSGLHEVPHFTLTHAIEITAPSGKRLVYGADCRQRA